MKAIAKIKSEIGFHIIDVDEPTIKCGHVKVKVEHASICGTDLHIYNWDTWASSRMQLPRIVGHEISGTIIEVGEGVGQSRIGEKIATESRIACGRCQLCLNNQRHLCEHLKILGVDIDGGFAPYVVIPTENARSVSDAIPTDIACMMDAIGNAVHLTSESPQTPESILILGLGPLGLFTSKICQMRTHTQLIGVEVSSYRIQLAKKLGLNTIINPNQEDLSEKLYQLAPKGVDLTLELSGHPASFETALKHTKAGGTISVMALYPNKIDQTDINRMVMNELKIQGLSGRLQWKTWDIMQALLKSKKLNVNEVISHRMPYLEIENAIRIMKEGNAGKIILEFSQN